MVRKLLNSWMLLPVLAFGLLSLGALAPIPDLLDKGLSWMAIAILLVYVGVPRGSTTARDKRISPVVPRSLLTTRCDLQPPAISVKPLIHQHAWSGSGA